MAKMTFRAKDHVRWVGVRPAHEGTQVYATGWQGDAGNNSFYTVVDTLYITYLCLTSSLSADVFASASITIYTAVPAVWRMIADQVFDKAGQQTSLIALPFPIEVPKDYTIRVVSSHANLGADAFFWGWEE